MISDARGKHVSPGVYTEEHDVTYSVKSLGITNLGLAGETLKGTAFQPISIESWTDFVDYFGATSTEKYPGTMIPKYELPYIAKSYLKKSKKLEVVRVLGLSGYDAGIPYIITASVSGVSYPLVVLRSKGSYEYDTANPCEKGNTQKLHFYVSKVEIAPYTGTTYGPDCSIISSSSVTFPLSGTVTEDNGVKIITYQEDGETKEFTSKFAIKVTYTKNVASEARQIIVTTDDENFDENCINTDAVLGVDGKPLHIDSFEDITEDVEKTVSYNVSLNPYDKDYIYKVFSNNPLVGNAPVFVEAVYDFAYNKLIQDSEVGAHVELGSHAWLDMYVDNSNKKHYIGGDYKEPFRCAETPWIVSEVQAASEETITMKKLFKFYTISDGNSSNYQVKISIQNINPQTGTFDVVVRDFSDIDESPTILEKFVGCSLEEGSSSFIGLKIGTYDGSYEIKSKFITVRLNDEEDITGSFPAGFLGYPMPTYGCDKKINIEYADVLNTDIKTKRQYFGLTSEIIDEDILNYKGVMSYSDTTGDAKPEKLTNGFHMDSILSDAVRLASGSSLAESVILVDGVSGFTFSTVNPIQQDIYPNIPRLIPGSYIKDTVYADINTRKFTVYPYGGFDGWDIYRATRSNTDEFSSTKYQITDSADCPFKRIGTGTFELDPMLNLNLPPKAITSDYYAYLGAYNQFANPEDVDINIFATPGIDWMRNTLLVEDVIDMIQDQDDGRGGDALYIPTTPQFDDYGNVLDASDVADLLEATGINTSYAATYFPWVNMYDQDEKKYIDLPPTKDVVRNMAQTDNDKFPWFSPAGTQRGIVECRKACIKTKLSDEDTLYNGLINPIKTFAADGVLVWGNKTMYSIESPLNRVNVRRLMLRVKKLIKSASKDLIFDQYDDSLEKQFRSLVEPILANVKTNRGIYDYKLKTEVTEETRDQHILPAKILIKPTPALEYISINFTVYPESVQFLDD